MVYFCYNLPAKQISYSSTIIILVTYCCIYYRNLLKGKLCQLLSHLYAISLHFACTQSHLLTGRPRAVYHLEIVFLQFCMPASTDTKRIEVGLREGPLTKLRSNLNEAELMKYEPRFCYCITYFLPKLFSEAHFSALFSFNKVSEQEALAILFPLLLKQRLKKL